MFTRLRMFLMSLLEKKKKYTKSIKVTQIKNENVTPLKKHTPLKYDLPAISNALHLSNKIGIKWEVYKDIARHPENHYHVFHIKKKNGGFRTIAAPNEELSMIQNYINENILFAYKIHKSAFGYVKGKSIIDVANHHLKSENFLSLDLENFFPSIGAERLYYYFGKLGGYDKSISDNLVRFCMYGTGIPQGACTSPQISNIIAYKLDLRLGELCQSKGLKYSRYVDDLTFSGETEHINDKLLFTVQKIIADEGFKLNSKKTRFGNNRNGFIITGLMIRNNSICVPSSYIKKIKNELYYINKYGLLDHKKREKIENSNYLEHIKGKINYVMHVDESKGLLVKEQFDKTILKINSMESDMRGLL
ncbi:retron St85 family RNA-directed DNA polymerase [Candidatus Izimaplasma bacterium ZiA1]|uniref:retron St85 family RNA-directed DNA polymerase n=1 Tax=Candidatus Izimoplasma sp. ZiA1 TaxID=2024899 RepID=UPI00143CBC73